MVKQVQGKIGKIYSYADDVPDELILEDIDLQEAPKSAADASFGEVISDIGTMAKQAGYAASEAAVGLTDVIGNTLVPGSNIAGRLESVGIAPGAMHEQTRKEYSPGMQAEINALDAAKGVGGTLSALAENPNALLPVLTDSAALMVGGMKVAQQLPKAIGGVARAAIGEGTIAAGSASEGIRGNGEANTPGQTAAAIASGIGTGTLGFLGGKLAQRWGINDIDTVMATGEFQATSKNFLRRMAEGGVSEGLFEELPQSVQEQMWQNFATDKPLMEGVAKAGTLGAIAGGLMGGGAGVVSGGKNPESTNDTFRELPPIQEVDPSVPPPAPKEKVEASPLTDAEVEFEANRELIAQIDASLDSMGLGEPVADVATEAPDPVTLAVNPQVVGLSERQVTDTGLTREVLSDPNNFSDKNTSVSRDQRRVLRAMGGSPVIGGKFSEQPLAALDTSQGPIVLQVGEDTHVRPSHYMKGAMEDIYKLAKEFNPTGIYVLLPEDTQPVGSKNHAAGGHIYQNGIHYIIPRHLTNLNKEGSHKSKEGENEYSTYAKAQAWSSLGHEFGHSVISSFLTSGLTKEEATLFEQGASSGKIDEAVIARLTTEAQAAVRAWEELRQKIMTKQIAGKQAALMWLSPAKLMSKQGMKESYGDGMGVFTPEALARTGFLDYQLNFHEFAAEQMAKMLYARGEMKVSKTLAATFKNYDPEGLMTWVDERVAAFLEPLLNIMKGIYFKIAGKEVTGDELQQIGVDAIPEMKIWFALLADNARQRGLARTTKSPTQKAPQSTEVEDLPVDWNSHTMQNKARATLQRLVREGVIRRNSKQHRQISGMLNRQDYDSFLEAIEPIYKVEKDAVGKMKFDLTESLMENMNNPGIHGKVEAWAAKYLRELLENNGGSREFGGSAVIDRPGRNFGPIKDYVTVGTMVGGLSYLYMMTPEAYARYNTEDRVARLQYGSISALMDAATHSVVEFAYQHDDGGISITAFPNQTLLAPDMQQMVKRDKEGMLQLQGTTWSQRLQLFGEMLARVRTAQDDTPYVRHVTWKRMSGAKFGKEGEAYFGLDATSMVGYAAMVGDNYVITADPLDAEFIGGRNFANPFLARVSIRNPVTVDGAELKDGIEAFAAMAKEYHMQQGNAGFLVPNYPGARGNVVVAYTPDSLDDSNLEPELGTRMRFDLASEEGSEAASKWMQLKNLGVPKLAEGLYKLYNAQWYGLQLQQLAHMNPQWIWLTEFAANALKYYRKVGEMHSRADTVLKQVEWIGKENLVKMGKFTRAEAKGGEHWTDMQVDAQDRWTHTPNATTYEKLKEFGIDPDSAGGRHFLSLYIEAKNANQYQMDEMERVLFALINRKYSGPTMHLQKAQTIKELRMTFRVRRKSPFWANDAFGQFHIAAFNRKDKVYEAATDSLREAEELKTAAIAKYGEAAVKSFEISYEESILMRLPVEFIDEASQVLGLDMNNPDDRAKRDALSELMGSLYSKSPDQAYDPNKMLVEGGSTDFQKNFANFAMKNANFIAKMEYRKYLQNSIAQARNEASDQRLVKNQEKINRAVEFMQGTANYMLNPQEEIAFIRGTIAISYLMYNVKTAVLNVVGLMATWATLNRELGYLKGTYTFGKTTVDAARTLGHEGGTVLTQIMTRAAQRANNSVTDPNWEMENGKPTELRRALEQAKSENVLDQSYAYYLAGQAMKGELSRMASASVPGRAFKGFIDTGMSLFRATELLTRRASFLAAYEVQQQVYPDKTEKQRYEEATRMVGLMQGDYTKGNRPELFRGQIKSFLFIFMTYVQNQAWATYGGMDKGLKKQDVMQGRVSPKFYRSYSMQMMLMLMFLAGPEGIPGGENIMDLIDIVYKWIFKKSARTAIREMLVEMEADPMLWTRGLAFNTAGFDIGKSIGLGRLAPMTDRLGQEYQNSTEAFGTMAYSAMGVGGGYVKWLVESAMLIGDTMQAGLPLTDAAGKVAAKLPGGPGNIFKAAQWAEIDARGPSGGLLAWDEEKERARSVHPWEIVGKGLGFQPSSVSRGQAMRMDANEVMAYWKHRKDFLYAAWGQANLIAGDRESIADVKLAIDRYNKQIPHKDLWITEKMLKQSLARREENLKRSDTMTPLAKSMRAIVEQAKETF